MQVREEFASRSGLVNILTLIAGLGLVVSPLTSCSGDKANVSRLSPQVTVERPSESAQCGIGPPVGLPPRSLLSKRQLGGGWWG